ncbi:hypothetical protein MalM25_23260 [Planctomycetes bacterium MalM25]|nr:hypothetical protein MalM25_23260 [Planctomycetes bacterium MalM25]
MRFTQIVLATLLACGLLAAQANAQGSGRYPNNPSSTGGSSINFEDAFKNLPSSGSNTGGYRSQPGTPPATAPKPPASNQLRSVSPPATSQSATSPPVRTTTPAAASSVSPSQASRSQAGVGRSYQQPAATRSPAASAYSTPPQSPQLGSTLQSRFEATPSTVSGERERNARQILSKMLNYNGTSELRGTPMSLASVVATAIDRDDQAERVEAYWMLSSAVADYYLGLAEVNEISALKQRANVHSTAINQALSKQRVRVGTALKAARAAQHRLAKKMGQGGMMPLPSDVPFTGPYNTRLATAFPTGAPAEARLINELLPLRLAEIYDSAESISQSQAWFKQVAQRAAATSDAEGVVRGLQLNALNRRAFVMLVRDYNLRISRYTQLTTPERVDTGRLVAMLIRTPQGGVRSADDALMAGFSAGAGSTAADSRFGTSTPSQR